MQSAAWKDQLNITLQKKFSVAEAKLLYQKYQQTFESVYEEECSTELVALDIELLEKITPQNPFELGFYIAPEHSDESLHLRLYRRNDLIPLSDILPVLSDFNFRVYSERTYKININDELIWISDFIVCCADPQKLCFDKMQPLFRDAFVEILAKRFESDGFNKLILEAQLSWREIMILRTYAKYLRQVGFRLTQNSIEQALVNNADITKNLIALFFARHNPKQKDIKLSEQLEENI
ncbi:MAG TPA: NAD-glutamate dehydrogenase, partial [Gammaproteobacteria bacterium]|nr:NAD-glutamate dehydrogenase [Gammaproteobacteria bacterium]